MHAILLGLSRASTLGMLVRGHACTGVPARGNRLVGEIPQQHEKDGIVPSKEMDAASLQESRCSFLNPCCRKYHCGLVHVIPSWWSGMGL